MMKRRKTMKMIALQGRYLFYVNIRMHSKPKMKLGNKKFENSD